MHRKPIIIAMLILLGVSSYFLWAYAGSLREGVDPENDFANWQPSADTIRNSLPKGTSEQRERQFALLFQKRFREHDPAKAIGVHFGPDGRLKLLTPARLEPWNIDRIALMLHREAQQDFAKNYEIDIYETFIGTPPIHIGELHPSMQTPSLVLVTYHYPQRAVFLLKPPPQSRLRVRMPYPGVRTGPQQAL